MSAAPTKADPLVVALVAELEAAADAGGFRVEPATLRQAAHVLRSLDRRGARVIAQLAALEREVDRLHARVMALELRRPAAADDHASPPARTGRRGPCRSCSVSGREAPARRTCHRSSMEHVRRVARGPSSEDARSLHSENALQ